MNKAEQTYLEKFKEHLLIKGYANSTATKTTYTTTIFIEWITEQGIELEQISYNDVLAYINYKRQSGNKSRSLAIITNCLNHFFNFLIAEYRIAENPASNIKIKGIKRKVLCEILTPDELETIYKSYNTEHIAKSLPPFGERKVGLPPQTLNNLAKRRNKIILGLVIYQGLRTQELAKLQLQDLQLREAKIVIHKGNRTEGRTLKLEAHQLFDLSDYINVIRKEILQATKKESALVFLSVGTSLHFTNVMQKLIQQLKTTNKKLIDAKHIRTSVITNWLKVHNLRKTQYMAGHRYISSTEAYQVNNIDALKEDISKFHPLA